MSEGKIAAAMLCVFVVATTAGTWAAWNSYITPAIAVTTGGETAALDASEQTINTTGKGDRLAVKADRLDDAVKTSAISPASENPAPTSFAPAQATYNVASLPTTAVEPPRPELRKSTIAIPEKPAAESKPAAAAAEKKAKRTEQQKLLLDDAQIAALRTRLKLTPTQEEFWPAVEVTLRDVVHAHARKGRNARVAPQIDVNSAEVQQLISAAVPLIMRLSEEQKREVRQLARIIGLETVASKI